MPQLQTRIRDLWRSGEVGRHFTVMMYPPPDSRLNDTEPEYRYKLDAYKPSFKKRDPVMGLIIKTIQELSKDDMFVAASCIRVYSMTDSLPLWPLTLANAGCSTKFYAFKEYHNEFPKTVPISIANRGKPGDLTPDRILVQDSGTWKPLVFWLKEFPQREWLINSTRKGLMAQRTWWERNGKFFRLFDLPKEIRIVLYRHILGSGCYPQTSMFSGTQGVCLGMVPTPDVLSPAPYMYAPDWLEHRSGALPSDTFKATYPNYAILRVSRQVSTEALEAGWIGTRKRFTCPSTLSAVVGAPMQPSGRYHNWLSKVELDLSITGFFEAFGIIITPILHINNAESVSNLLQGMKSLKDIQLRFPDPYEAQWQPGNPWHMFHLLYKSRDWFSLDNRYSDMATIPCHKIVVDWILLFTFPSIKHIRRIRLEGAIKISVKDKWDSIFATQSSRDAFDWQAEANRILGTPNFATPKCFCPLRCDGSNKLYWIEEFDCDDKFSSEMVDYHEQLHWDAAQLFRPFGDNTGLDEIDAKAKARDEAARVESRGSEVQSLDSTYGSNVSKGDDSCSDSCHNQAEGDGGDGWACAK